MKAIKKWEKADLQKLFKQMIPSFNYTDLEKYLEGKM